MAASSAACYGAIGTNCRQQTPALTVYHFEILLESDEYDLRVRGHGKWIPPPGAAAAATAAAAGYQILLSKYSSSLVP